MLTSVGIALATHTGGGLNETTTGAHFGGGWNWYHKDQAHGGFHFWGDLDDTVCGDGDNVYSKVKAANWSPTSLYGQQCGSEYQNYEVWDEDQVTTTYIEFSVCRDRSFPYSDNCSSKRVFRR